MLGLGRGQASPAEAVYPPFTDFEVMQQRCDGCGDCVDACADGLIAIAPDGLPHLSFDEHGCTLCGDCRDACPTQAIGTLAVKALHPFPHVFDATARCLSVRGVTCRLCEDACEPQAIRFRLWTGGRAVPIISEDACTGCGECSAVCPEHALARRPRGSASANADTDRWEAAS